METGKLPHNHNHSIEQDFDHMPKVHEFATVADVFKMLGDATRVRLLWILFHCEECVLNLSVMMDMSSPAISHHLKLLKTAGLITSRRAGKEVYYKAAETELTDALHNIIEKVAEIFCPESR